MRKGETRSRMQIIIDEILCGGFTEDELQEIIDICEDEITNKDTQNGT